MGSTDSQGQNIKVYGNRFDVPPMKYDHLANCCFFFKPEAYTQGYVNVQAIGNWFNGGGYTTYLTPACSVDKCPQLYYEHNRFGYGHQFGPIILNDAWKGTNGNHNLAATNGSYVDNGYVTTLQTGSVVYYNGEADEANRVFSIEDMTETDITVMVNLANYMTIARGYRISVEVLNAEGYAVASVVQSGEVRRYTPVKEYYVASNTQTITLPSGQTVEQLIEIPDFPQNVPAYITVNDLPADLAGHSISIKVYDETNGETKLIRTSLLGEDIYDHCRPEEDNSDIPEETTYTVTFQDADGHVISTQTVKAGQGATAPTAPQKEGYTFSGWSVDFSQVNGNLVVVAQYTKNETPPAEQSQELSDFIAAVEKAENTANADLSARLCAIYEADLLWWKIENIEEEGAREAYERFVLVLSLYNQDLKRINGVLQDAEDVASYLCGVPSEN
ncbi:MAG: InlB B-repeat-containing protein [Clostridia bacterium]|nr:InlB B-repeat-containing protein [Clostridia bacterium]